MIDTMNIIKVINEKSGGSYHGNELEYFVDDSADIGEVYLDGDLIYQSTSIYNEDDLKIKFNEAFSITKEESTNG
tara:strand:- start:2801 stop:3025 length:225 start_codon:yes stop_codon:yes gene_type:complete